MLAAALERIDNVADGDHAFAVLKRGYPRRKAPFPLRFLTSVGKINNPRPPRSALSTSCFKSV